MVDMGPRKVEWPVLIVNPDNEIECGRKLYDDKSAPPKEDPSNYFESKPSRLYQVGSRQQ